MPKLSMPRDQPQRTSTTLLVALFVLFLLGPPVAPAIAREDTTGVENSEQTIIQESTSANGASGESAGTGDAKVGNGEAIAGGAYAGNGCARAGDVTAGDCGEKAGGGSWDGGSDDASRLEKGEEETSAPETTIEGTISEETNLEDTTLEETTLVQETTGGETTSSPIPAPDEAPLCPVRPPQDAIEATVGDTADGDTLALAEEVEGYDKVRLIGVDTPELRGEDGRPEPFAEEASDFTTGELEGQEVLLQVDEGEADRYGRLLAYVWTAPGDGFVGGLKRMVGMGEAELFNLTLLEEGYAKALTIQPNDLYADCFEAAEREARDAGVGIWAEEEDPGGPTTVQYGEETTAETTPTGEVPDEASTIAEDDSAAREPERQTSPAAQQYEQSPPPEARPPEPEAQEGEVQEPEIQDEEIQEPEVQKSVAPSGGDETAVLETAATPAASASPEPTGTLPVRTASTAPVSVLPETGGPSLLAFAAGLAVVGLLAGTALGFLTVRSSIRRDAPGGG